MANGGLATLALRGGASSGDTTLTATAAGLTTATTTVTTAAQTISSALLTADPAVLAADNSSQSQLRVTLLDQAGHPYLGAATDGWTAEFSSSDTAVLTVPTAAIAAVADAANGAHVDTLATVRNNVGAAQVAAVIQQGAATRFTGSLSVSSALVGSPYRITADPVEDATARQIGGTESQRVVFRIKDANGNQVTSLNNFTNLSLQFLADDPLYTVLVSPADGVTPLNPKVGSGTYLSSANASIWAGKITLITASPLAQTVDYQLAGEYAAGGPATQLLPAAVSGTFLAGAPTQITLEASPNGSVGSKVNPGASGVLTAKLRDRAD